MSFFQYLDLLEEFFSTYIGFLLICLGGIYLTIYSKGFQFRALAEIRPNLKKIFQESRSTSNAGVNPFKLYFASVGGMIGIGNIVGVGSAVFIGGPGSIFWMWIASFCGMLMKYGEIYLGVKYRVKNSNGGYDGGPMYYLQAAFGGRFGKFLSYLSALLLCIYGIEIFQFTVVTQKLQTFFAVDQYIVIGLLLVLVLAGGLGGIQRLANVCSVIMPVFMGLYIMLCLLIIVINIGSLPEVFYQIISTAFTGQAQIGGFLGSSLILCGHKGTSASIYAGDIGIGYDSVIQSETKIADPRKQAELAIYALFSDTLICSMTTIVIAITGAWHKMNHLPQTHVMAEIFKNYIPFSETFMTVVLFFAGYTTIIAFFTVGMKSASFISPKYGKIIFVPWAIASFIFFSYSEPEKAKTVMLIAAMLLVLINTVAIFRLRKQIDFSNNE